MRCWKIRLLIKQSLHKWRSGDQAMLAGEPVTIAGFIDRGGAGPLDEILVELANGEERTVDEAAMIETLHALISPTR